MDLYDPRAVMAEKPDPDKTRGPGGMSMRELHELVKKSHQRDQQAGKQHNKLAQPQNRWQRFVRYVWDKNRGRG
jgi:hypothetical protein